MHQIFRDAGLNTDRQNTQAAQYSTTAGSDYMFHFKLRPNLINAARNSGFCI